MLKQFKLFYKEEGVIRLTSFLTPTPIDFNEFCLGSIYHHVPDPMIEDAISPNPDSSKLYFHGYSKPIPVTHVLEYIDPIYQARQIVYNARKETSDYFSKNKSMKYAFENQIIEPNMHNLVVYNYGHLIHNHVYPKIYMAPEYKFVNTYKTVFANCDSLAGSNSRNHFIFVELDDEIPSLTMLNTYTEADSVASLRIFNNSYKRLIKEFWFWLDPETRDKSIIDLIQPKHYNKVNFVFWTKEQKAVVVNLSYLNSWIKGQLNETSFVSIQQVYPIQLKKVFLKFLITLTSVTEINEASNLLAAASVSKEKEIANKEDNVSENEEGDTLSSLASKHVAVNAPGSVLIKKLEPVKDAPLVAEETEVSIAFKTLDEDLAFHDAKEKELNSVVFAKPSGVTQEAVMPSMENITSGHLTFIDEHASLRQRVERLATVRAYSAADYKKAMADITASENLLDPYDAKKKLKESKVIDSSELLIDKTKEEIHSSYIVGLVDGDMNKSSLNSYNSDYVTKVMKKDIIGAVSAIQKSGVLIRNYDIVTEKTALGEYEYHIIELKPLDGASSIVRVQLPKVNKDGTYTSSGNKYSLRKQRVD